MCQQLSALESTQGGILELYFNKLVSFYLL